jgi:hypothetical protein
MDAVGIDVTLAPPFEATRDDARICGGDCGVERWVDILILHYLKGAISSGIWIPTVPQVRRR